MTAKGTVYINIYMAAPAGYTKDDFVANLDIALDGNAVSDDNIFINAKKGFAGRADDDGVKNPFVRVRIGANGTEYVDLAAGAHTLTFTGKGDNAPDFDVIAIRPWTLGQYYVYTELSVDASAAKKDYMEGDEFSSEGIVVTATKRDGSKETLEAGEYTVSEPDMDTMGEKTINIAFGKLSASYTITVSMNMEGYEQVIFEGENSNVELGPGDTGSMPNTSEVTHIGGLNGNVGATVTFRIDGGETGGTAVLFVSVCTRPSAITFSESMSVTVNDAPFETTAVVPGTATGADTWNEFEVVNLGSITLKPGENTIVFTVISSDIFKGFNFDKIILAVADDAGWTPAWYEAA